MNNSPRTFLVFVYGSLLKGLGNHRLLENSGVKFVEETTVRAKLYTSHWAWPFMIFSLSNKDKLKGEVYEVDLATFRRLDMLEGYSPGRCDGLFIRKNATTASGKTVWIYEGGPGLRFDRQNTLIKSGDWRVAYTDYHKSNQTPFYWDDESYWTEDDSTEEIHVHDGMKEAYHDDAC